MNRKLYTLIFSLLLSAGSLFNPFQLQAQLTVTTVSTAAALTSTLVGPGVSIVSDTLICNTRASGTFTSVTTPLTIGAGIILCTGTATQCAGSEPSLTSTRFGGTGDADLTSYLGTTTVSYDACELIINFVPKGDTVSFNYQFGSEEYRQSTCGDYDDAFAFFIMGPGVSASYPGVNMALVPGTTIPVAVNTINSGTPGTTAGCNIRNCTAYGGSSPYTSLYIDNTGGASISYRGYTKELTAKHWVIPCDTYRIKMSIVDAGNDQYDSGVFIEAGSLKTNSYQFDHSVGETINGTSNTIVKGCPQDSLRVVSETPVASATTLYLSYGGTAVSGVDYVAMQDSIVMGAGATEVSLPLTALVTTATGTKTLSVYLTSGFACGSTDTINFTILDKPQAAVITRDTTVCLGTPVQILTHGSDGLTYSWSPATTLNNTTLAEPTASPTGPITYTMSALLGGSLCPAITDTSHINVVNILVSITTPDTTICQNSSIQLVATGSPGITYAWSPATGLDNPGSPNPIATPLSTTTYSLSVSQAGNTCKASAAVTITVIPTDFKIVTRDTFLCTGASLMLNVDVLPASAGYTYSWTGPNGFASLLQNPVITTATALNEGTYNLWVTSEGRCKLPATEKIMVYPTPSDSILAAPIVVCQYSPAMPLVVPGYNNLVWYNTVSDTVPNLAAPYPQRDTIGDFIYYAAQISFVSNCIGSKIPVDVTVKSCCTGAISVPSAFSPNGDGLNDYLRVIKSSDYSIDEFAIYDRWGMLVYQSSGENQSWDGTYKGVKADAGTYFYYLVVNCVNSDKHPIVLKGNVTLVR